MKKAILLFIMLNMITIFMYGHLYNYFIYYNQALASISYIAIIFSAVFVAYQAYLFRKDYEARKEHSEFDTAYKLAGYYAKNILPNTHFSNKLLSEINLKIDKDFYKKSNLFINFTEIEAQKIFGIDVIKIFDKEITDANNIDFVLYEHHKTNIPRIKIKEEWNNLLKNCKSKSKNKPINISKEEREFYNDKYNELINYTLSILNDIEYFAMYFCSKLAAPETVYMSLHQTYLEFMMNNYLLICYQNSKPGHEYYTHAIQLYNIWSEISNKRDKEREEALNKINSPEKPKKLHS